MEVDKINPPHYKRNGMEVIDINEAYELNFSRGNMIKYTLRAGEKPEEGMTALEKEIEDMKKVQWYNAREIKRLEKLND